MSDQKPACACSGAPTLVFACSGASDTGEIADRAARRMRDEGIARMYCLMGIGGKVGTILDTTKAAAKVVVIDGCPTDCARKTMEQGGLAGFIHLRVTDLGMEKGKTAVTDDNVARVASSAAELLAK